MNLIEYIQKHADRGACRCGHCIDAPENPEDQQPGGHTADMIFFEVSAKETANAEDLRKLIAEHQGEWGECSPLDGKEHNYMELGAWVGDQGLALMLMGLGAVLGIWKLLTPRTMLGKDLPEDLVKMMAGQGFVAVQVG